MKIAVPKERLSDEMRVAASPDSIKKLSTLGFSFSIETGAGDGASFSDEALKGSRCRNCIECKSSNFRQ